MGLINDCHDACRRRIRRIRLGAKDVLRRWSSKAKYRLAVAISEVRVPAVLLKDVIAVNQAWPVRIRAMSRIIRDNFSGPIFAIEVGTWFGEGSTRLWFAQLAPGSSLLLIDSWTPYVSKEDQATAGLQYKRMDSFHLSALRNAISVVDEEKQRGIDVTVARGRGTSMLDRLAESSADFVYIDGSHYYEDVLADIRSALRVVKKDYGILCGDDLELGVRADLLDRARANVEHDCITTEAGSFHPGVMLAVHETLGEVNCDNGFWWVYLKDGEIRKTRD